MPTSGSISRSAVNASSDVKTQAGGIYSGTLVLLALAVLMPYCAYIPKASLAAVIITSVIYSVDYQIVMSIWRTKWVDLIPGFMSFFATLFWALEYGIMVGIAIQLLFLLCAIARPSIKVTSRWIGKTRILLLGPDSDLVFPAINYVRDVINKAGTEYGLSKWPVVLDCSHVARADFTAAQEFQSLLLDFKKHEQLLLFFKANRSVEATLKGLTQESIFVANDTELTAYIKNVCHSN
jgi:sodium-independent sulfate anion transporter 11